MRKRTNLNKRKPYKLGTTFTGIVDEVKRWGAIVLIDNKKTKALLHISEIETTTTTTKSEEEEVKAEEETTTTTTTKSEKEVSDKEAKEEVVEIGLVKGQEVNVTVIEDDGKKVKLSQKNQADLQMILQAKGEGFEFKSDNFKNIGIVGYALSDAGISRDMFPNIDEVRIII